MRPSGVDRVTTTPNDRTVRPSEGPLSRSRCASSLARTETGHRQRGPLSACAPAARRAAQDDAHRAALEAGGRTIAVLGNGTDSVYPEKHARLAQEIAQSGAVLTEFPPGTEPARERFPQRNRIISGLSMAVLVTEAPSRSGALLTASFANHQGRDVLAVPGDVFSVLSAGCNALIRDGAIMVRNSEDVL